MNRFRYINYNPKILSKEPNTKKLVQSIKEKIVLPTDKLIFEKHPQKIDYKINPDKHRYISQTQDFIFVFCSGEVNDVALVWHNDYYNEKHCSVYNGRGILIEAKIYAHTNFFVKQKKESIYSIVLCNFVNYNLVSFVNHHSSCSINLNTNYDII